MGKDFDDGKNNGQFGKAPMPTDAGIPVRPEEAAMYGNGGQYGYQQAEIHYTDYGGQPAEGTLLYPETTSNPAQAPKLNRFRIQGFKDVWATFVFAIFVLFSIVWSVVQIATYHFDLGAKESPFSQVDGRRLSWFIVACLASIIASVISSIVMLTLMQLIPVQMIYVANIMSILMFVAAAVIAFLLLNVIAGIVMVICGILQAVWFFLVRHRIPFAAALLKTSAKIISTYKFTVVLNLILCIVSFGYVALWGFGVAAPVDRLYKDQGNAGYVVAIVLLVFTMLWVTQVTPNVMHVTTSGLVATWYFAGSDNMPRNPTLASFKRATTTSFGSICFGSLLVAIIQFIRWLVESSGSDSENGFLRCLLSCILQCIERILEYFNRYAFVHVAIYGCSYIEGAKRTFALCKQCFFSAVFNDCLVSPTLSMFSLAVSLVFALVAGILAKSWPLGVLVFLVSVLVHSLFFVPVESAVTTVFVCFAECPEALRESDLPLYTAIHAADANGTHNNAPPPL